ncbi:glycosyltransferase family 4 protein [Desulfobacter latus]|nr:glycosyltransferase family 4 protein [Desulfobacter latus]
MMLTLPLKWPAHDYDILQFHRIEPALCFPFSKKSKLVFIHQNMEVIESRNSDIRWKYAPFLYYKLEDFLIPRFAGVNIVHEQAVHTYRRRYVKAADKINFVPTWMDPRIFYPLDPIMKKERKALFLKKNGIADDTRLLISVGRIDHQKNPSLLVKSFLEIRKSIPNAHLVAVGDGVLRKEMETEISNYGLTDHVSLTGILPYTEVAELLRISDLLVLSSRYEGMPRCVIEALGCGIPVATTDVGEVKRVVETGKNGHISEKQTVESLSAAILDCLKNSSNYSEKKCCQAVTHYTPQKVLAPVYEFYRIHAKAQVTGTLK